VVRGCTRDQGKAGEKGKTRRTNQSHLVGCLRPASDFRFPPISQIPFDPPASFPALPFHSLINIPCLHPISIPSRLLSPACLYHHSNHDQRASLYPIAYSLVSSPSPTLSPHHSNWILRTTIAQTCPPSSVMPRVSGSSTSTGTCSLNAASGTRKEEALISGNAFVPVRPIPMLTFSHVHSPAHCFVMLYRPFYTWNAG